MSLFSMNDIKGAEVEAAPEQELLITQGLAADCIFFSRNQTLKQIIPDLADNHCYHFWSDGKWHLHELLFHILEITGPAELQIATWSIKELPMRLLTQARVGGAITGIHCLVDKRVKYQNPDVWAMGQLNFDSMVEGSVHAKVTVIHNNRWDVTIVGSANYTNNPRQEAGSIITSRPVAVFFYNKITEAIEGGKAC